MISDFFPSNCCILRDSILGENTVFNTFTQFIFYPLTTPHPGTCPVPTADPPSIEWDFFYACVEREVETYLRTQTDLPDSVTDVPDIFEVSVMYSRMRQYLRDWRYALKMKNDITSDQSLIDLVRTLGGQDHLPYVLFPAPYLFDRGIAAPGKTTTELRFLQVDPYEIGAKLEFAPEDAIPIDEDAATDPYAEHRNCTGANTKDTGLSLTLKNVLLRRLDELQGRPLPNMADWKFRSFEFGSDVLRAVGGVTFDRSFKDLKFDEDSGGMLPGNLTEGIVGRSAEWLMVTPYYETSELQDLVFNVQDSSAPYSRVAADVYQDDNPCDEAATNSDVFLFAFSIALVSWLCFCLGMALFRTGAGRAASQQRSKLILPFPSEIVYISFEY